MPGAKGRSDRASVAAGMSTEAAIADRDFVILL